MWKTNHPSPISKPNWSFWYYSHWKPSGALGHTVVDQFCPPLHPRHHPHPPCSRWMMFHHGLSLSPGLEAVGSRISEKYDWYMHTASTISCRKHHQLVTYVYIIMASLGSSYIMFSIQAGRSHWYRGLSSLKLPTQAMTYPQGHFQQLILVSPGMMVPAPPSTRAQQNPFLRYGHLQGAMMIGRWDLQFNLGSMSWGRDRIHHIPKVKVSLCEQKNLHTVLSRNQTQNSHDPRQHGPQWYMNI
jgi:hypothetical protein